MMHRHILPALSVLLLASACSESQCEKYGNKLCDQACACTPGDACTVSFGTLSLSWDSKSDCKAFYDLLACGDDDPTDYEDCSMALEQATCGEDGGGDTVLLHPPCDMGNQPLAPEPEWSSQLDDAQELRN